jgi:hypothetical protein
VAKHRKKKPGMDIHMGIDVKKRPTRKCRKKGSRTMSRRVLPPRRLASPALPLLRLHRLGQTKLMTYMIYQDILNGTTSSSSTQERSPRERRAHGGNELLSYVVQACVQAGRLDELLIVTPSSPNAPLSSNPLKHFMIEDELVQQSYPA